MSDPVSIHDVLSTALAQRLGWALIHFLWQGAAVAVLLALMLQLLRRRSPQARWLASCAALGVMAALPVITALAVSVQPRMEARPGPGIAAAGPAASLLSPIRAGHETPDADRRPSEALAQPLQKTPWTERVVALLRPLLPYCVLLWLAGVAALSLWHVGGWWQLQRARRLGTRPVNGLIDEAFADLVRKLHVGRPVRLLESTRAAVPVVVGWLRPVVLLPASAISGLTPEQMQAVLAHELAHVRRHDCLVKVAQAVIETLLFYHPAVWWVSGRITEESEQCCDDLALEVCGDRQAYARALAQAAELGLGAAHMAAASSGGQLLPRIRRIVNIDKEGQAMGTRWVAGLMTLGVAALLAIGPLVLPVVAQPEVTARGRLVEQGEGAANLQRRGNALGLPDEAATPGGLISGGGRESDEPGPKVLVTLQLVQVTDQGEEVIWSPRPVKIPDGRRVLVSQTTSIDYTPPRAAADREVEQGTVHLGVDLRITARVQPPVQGETKRTFALTISSKLRWLQGYVKGTGFPVVGSQEYEATVPARDGETMEFPVSPVVPPTGVAKGTPVPLEQYLPGPRYVLKLTAEYRTE